MCKAKICSRLFLMIVLIIISAAAISAKPTAGKLDFAVRKVDQQVVLYTIYRGSYSETGPAVGNLFALAGRKGIQPRGSAYYVYLNNPAYVSSEHLLTEIRIPVDKQSLKFSGSLGEMTDIKLLPAVEVAVAIKPKGQTDPGPVYDKLHRWIPKQGYIATGSAWEKFLSGAATGSYGQMKTEIMVPVKKLPQNKN